MNVAASLRGTSFRLPRLRWSVLATWIAFAALCRLLVHISWATSGLFYADISSTWEPEFTSSSVAILDVVAAANVLTASDVGPAPETWSTRKRGLATGVFVVGDRSVPIVYAIEADRKKGMSEFSGDLEIVPIEGRPTIVVGQWRSWCGWLTDAAAHHHPTLRRLEVADRAEGPWQSLAGSTDPARFCDTYPAYGTQHTNRAIYLRAAM